MKIIITADIHCGYPGRLKDNIWSLMAISNYASKNNINTIMCLGDLFHNRDHLTIDVLNAAHLFFKNSEQNWIIFPGNHDMFLKTSWKITSIKPLEKYDNIKIYNTISSFKLDNRNFVVIPFIHHESQYMESLSEAESANPKESVLITHIGVNNAVNNSCFLLKNWSMVNLSKIKFDLVLSGHFHNYQIVDNKIYYPGSPIPFRFDEGMVDHGFLELDTDNLDVKFISLRKIRDDYPTDFMTFSDDAINPANVKNNKVRILLNREYSKSELDKMRDDILLQGAKSVSWMKSNEKQPEQKQTIVKTDSTKSPFVQWLGTQDNTKYNIELLMKLYNNISEEADDLYNNENRIEE